MRIFLVTFIVLLGTAYFGGVESEETAVLNRQKRQDNVFYVAVKEGNMWTYVARRKIGENLIVGKYILEWRSIYIPYHGKELVFQDGIDFLTLKVEYKWIPYPDYIPPKAIAFGNEGRTKLYVGYKQHEGKALIGKIVQGINAIFCPYYSKEVKFDNDFYILVEK